MRDDRGIRRRGYSIKMSIIVKILLCLDGLSDAITDCIDDRMRFCFSAWKFPCHHALESKTDNVKSATLATGSSDRTEITTCEMK